MGHFKVISKQKLADLKIGAKVDESDFATLTPEGVFVQLEYVEEDENVNKTIIKPGIWAIEKSMQGLFIKKTSFVEDQILDDFVHTKDISKKVECFFKNINVYKEMGFEVAKRSMLFYGPPGTGKSTVINKVCQQYADKEDTAIIVWHTDKFEAHEVKSFIQSFEYEGVEKLILVIEDIGGVEIDNVRMRSESSLLSLLDNQEKTFTIPVLILATTNHPEIFMGSLTNRPNRIDDKIEVGFPEADARVALLKFFGKDNITDEHVKELSNKKYEEFTPAHIREIVIKSAIYDEEITSVIKNMKIDIDKYNNAFHEKKRGVGLC